MLDYQYALIGLIILFCSVFCLALTWKKPNNKSFRTTKLWKFGILNAIFFSAGLIALIISLPLSLLTILSWVVYDLVITYVFTFEVPGYLALSKSDDKVVEALKSLREVLINMPLSFHDSLEELKTKKTSCMQYLKGENIDKLLDDFISLSDSLGNLNEKVWSLTLNETSNYIEDVSKKSKHPFPKLIDILALSGLSFLIAQFLKILD